MGEVFERDPAQGVRVGWVRFYVENKDSKDSKDNKDTKDNKESSDNKDTKDNKESNDNKDTKDERTPTCLLSSVSGWPEGP